MGKQLTPAEAGELEDGVRKLRDTLAVIATSAQDQTREALSSVAALGARHADEMLGVFK